MGNKISFLRNFQIDFWKIVNENSTNVETCLIQDKKYISIDKILIVGFI